MFVNEPLKQKIVLVMVGLPARGKTHTAQKLARYLTWLGYKTMVFNVGQYRRSQLDPHQGHEFFDPTNPVGRKLRLEFAMAVMDDMLHWLRDVGQVAIYDATNTTKARRKLVRERCEEEGLKVQFIETLCDDPNIVEANIRETKVSSPDYAAVNPDEAVRDFRARIAHYEGIYEQLGIEERCSYVKLIDMGRQIVLNNIEGYLASNIVFFLMNLHITPRPIWITRHGESRSNLKGLIGGDAPLSQRGKQFSLALAELLNQHFPKEGGITVWTSTLRRAQQTAQLLDRKWTSWRALDEIDAGICNDMTYDQIKEKMPKEFAARAKDKLRYRYPRGESYEDVIQRLNPVIIGLERHRTPVLVIAHQAVLRALYAYFVDLPPEQIPHLSIPLHTAIQLRPRAYGCDENRIPLRPSV